MRWPENIARIKNSLSKFHTQSALVAVSMLALLAIVFYPGYMSPDSISHDDRSEERLLKVANGVGRHISRIENNGKQR